MTVEQVEEQTESKEETNIEKEGAAKEYSQEYLEEILAAAKEYLPKSVWDHIHSRARPKAGGRVSGKARQAARAAASSQNAENAPSAEAVQQPPEVEAQLQEARSQGLHKSEESSWTSNAYPQSEVPVEKEDAAEVEKQDIHPDCQKVAENCMKMKKEDLEETEKAAHGKLNAPVAEGSWDAGAAQKRLLEWAGGPDKENVDWGKFGKGFLYHDESAPDNITSYKFPIADVQGNKLVINRSALAAAAGRINQTSGISPAELDRMKSVLRGHYSDLGVDAPANIGKEAASEPETKEVEKMEPIEPSEPIEPFVGSQPLVAAQQPLITFVAASPGVIESLRKEALVGPAGRIFDEHYLKPLELTRDQIAITYLVPRLLKDEAGKVREPTESEIKTYLADLQNEFDIARRDGVAGATSDPLVVALGHTVKKALGSTVDVTLPHPNALGTVRTNEELLRKREQLKKMVEAKINYTKYGRVVGKK